ncbi:metallophosphoesterase family protein [Caballeronia sp. LP006]|uniref:metallophosphoesterase family protein n=1 Tax=unclassified Caballeronia TaxID=2646786 RepID=UPI00202894D4|nr:MULTISPECIES: metallophosphoesterase family protein [unclassified Caballeronia]MDR5771161.1 metallophosphoesterase family protein [Caballeronia sp. LZ002]MDR5830853.1 metallophosphoesterase family protein [Caballeronia sp. LP006]MDR5846598.1 metallophosphoesterase family protein [Caballeronia sp. LZ003]
MTLIGLISDTHNLVRPEALEALRGSAHIIHAGDICKREVLDTLAQLAALTVVRGNNDIGDDVAMLPEHARIDLAGATIHVVHDIADVPKALDGVHVVVTGHSHKPLVEKRNGVLFVNPGSAGPRRFKLPITVGLLEIGETGDSEDTDIKARIVTLIE